MLHLMIRWGLLGKGVLTPRLLPEISFWWFLYSTQLLLADSFVVDDHLDGIGEHQNLGGRTVAVVVLLYVVFLLLSLRKVKVSLLICIFKLSTSCC